MFGLASRNDWIQPGYSFPRADTLGEATGLPLVPLPGSAAAACSSVFGEWPPPVPGGSRNDLLKGPLDRYRANAEYALLH